MSTPRLHRTVLGESGDPVVFLHGLFGQGKNWTSIGKALADRHRVVLLDLPNHGRSDWSETVGYREAADAVATSLEELGREFGARQWSVIGHSMGGKTAMVLALRHPELVRRLCVVDIAPIRYPKLSGFADYVRGMRAVDLESLSGRGQAETTLEPLVPDPVVRSFLLQNLRRDSRLETGKTGEERQAGWEESQAGVRWRWQMNLRLLGDSLVELGDWPDLGSEAVRYPGPVLWIAGGRSDYIRPEYAPAMRALFPAVRLVTIKQAGHWVHSEQPAVFLDVVNRFLAADSIG